jgi:hypothetical protein
MCFIVQRQWPTAISRLARDFIDDAGLIRMVREQAVDLALATTETDKKNDKETGAFLHRVLDRLGLPPVSISKLDSVCKGLDVPGWDASSTIRHLSSSLNLRRPATPAARTDMLLVATLVIGTVI